MILGVIAVAKSEVEPVGTITDRLTSALEHIDADRLLAAPDCGLGLLNRELVRSKLSNMCEAVRTIG